MYWYFNIRFPSHTCPVRAPGCKNWPTPFPDRMLYKATKPGLVSVLYLSMHSTVLLFIRAPFNVLLVFVAMCSVFWLFLLSYQYLPNDWLERPLRKAIHGEVIVSRKPRPNSAHDFLGLLYCFIVLLCICVVSCPYMTYFLLSWRDITYLCWKCC